jgi:hypothetical protein
LPYQRVVASVWYRGITTETFVPTQNHDDWTRAWCVAICRCALLAIQTKEE